MDIKISDFLANYTEQVYVRSIALREVILDTLPNVIEQLDIPAKNGGLLLWSKIC